MSSNFDILSNVLDSLRICGSTLLRESYVAPWAIAVPAGPKLGKLMNVQSGVRAVAFHLVERGYIELTTPNPDQPTLVVNAGEMVICFNGSPHQIAQGAYNQTLKVEDVLGGAEIPFRCPSNEPGSSVICLCGVFYLHDTHLNPLFAALPPILKAPVSQTATFQNLWGVAHLIAQELEQPSPGSNFMVERLLELLCAGAVRAYMAQLDSQDSNWLTGLRDPIIGRTLAMIHTQPGQDWSIERLAQAVALSPSRFAARFKSTLGESPMGYVAKWRIHVASQLLRTSESNISTIAAEVGYENLAAFNRAFKRHLDVPPGVWRSRHSG